MLNTCMLHGRTAFVGELRIQKLTNSTTKEEFEKKTVDFRIAVPKSVAPVKVVKDGVETTEVPTDFFYCQATGKIAEVISAHCSGKNSDGKLISREIILQGHMEMFQQDKKIEGKQKTKINGVIYEVPVNMTIKVDVAKFVVERLDFCGPKPESDKITTAQLVSTSNEDIPEAIPVSSNSTSTAMNPPETTSVISENNTPSIPEGYNGEEAPF